MKYKKIMFVLVLAIFIFGAASVCATDVNDTVVASDDSAGELSQADTDNIISSDEDEKIAQTENIELVSNASKGNFSELRDLIYAAPAGSTVVLDKDYECEDGFRIDGIRYEKFLTIDGNGHTLDARGNSRVFEIHESGVLKNINFINGNGGAGWGIAWFKYDGVVTNCTFTNGFCEHGAGVYISETGTVTNCTFDGNTATDEGGAIWIKRGSVTNCTFTNNRATGNYADGGAICTWGTISLTNCTFINNYGRDGGAVNLAGPVINCTFINNTAWRDGGAVYDWGKVNAINCTFTGNAANRNGGAFYFRDMDEYANVINCSFNGNNASAGSAIYFDSGSVSKTLTNCVLLDNRVNAALNVIRNENNLTITLTGNDNLLTAIYSPNDVIFNNVTYYGLKEIINTDSSAVKPSRSNVAYRQNVTFLVIDGNATEVNETLITDDNGMAVVPIDIEHDSYYIRVNHDANTYYNTVEQVIAQFTVNITSQETDNQTVNLTAKCIFNLPLPGYMQFVMPNGDKVRANYDSKGNWWAQYKFDAIGVYEVTGSYVGLNNITFNNGTITIHKGNSTITLDDIVMDYGESENVTVTTEGATAITASIDGTNVTVIDNYTIPISGLAAGNYTLTVTTIPDDDHYAVTETSTITVNKLNSTLTADDIIFDYAGEGSGNVSFTGATEVTAIVVNQPKAVVSVNGKKITVSGLAAGTYTLNVTTVPDENHTAVTETATITVNKVNSSLTVDNVELDYGDSINVAVTTDGATGITAKIDDVNVTVKGYTIPVSGLDAGNHTLTVTTIADENHTAVTETANITVNKASTSISIASETLDLKVSDDGTISANLTPADAGNLTFTSSDNKIVTVDAKGNVKAVSEGKADITVSFAGDDNYDAAESKTVTVTVSLNDASVSAKDITLNVGANATIDVTVVPEGLDVTYVSDNSGVVTVENGVVTAVKEGTAKVTLKVGGDGVYAENSTTITVKVGKFATEIAASPVTMIYKDDEYLIAKLTYTDGNPLVGFNVTVDLNGNKTYTTDENGQFNVSLSNLTPATYTAKIAFAGDDKYLASNATAKVVVKKATPKVTAKAKTFKTLTKIKKYTIVLKDNKGKAIKNAKVYLKVNGKTYKATTNSKGKATFKVTKLTNKGSYKAVVTYKGNKYYNKVTKKATINVKPVWKTVAKGSKLKTTVKKIQKALKKHGYYLSYNGHYLKVDGIYWDYTKMAVKQFQKAKGLKVNGKVDEKTAIKLGLI